jgi:hypothetical protein
MNTWNDHVKYQMLLDALNLNNNSFVSLSSEYYRSFFPVFDFHTFVGGLVALTNAPNADHNLFAVDTSNFLLGIPFAADSSHREGFARTSTDMNWTTHGSTLVNPISGVIGSTFSKEVFAVNCVFSAVCDCNLIMMNSFDAIPNQCYSMQAALNM